MANSEVEIVNSALVKIGEPPITSLNQSNRRARRAKQQYPLKRDELVARYMWNFAKRRIILAPDAETPAFGFNYQFTLPADSLRIIGIYDETLGQNNYTGSDIPWVVEDGKLLFNSDAPNIFYLAQVTDVSKFPPVFSEALAWMLANDLAFFLSTGASMVTQTEQGLNRTLRTAKLTNAIEGLPEITQTSEWLDSRFTNNRGPFRAGPATAT